MTMIKSRSLVLALTMIAVASASAACSKQDDSKEARLSRAKDYLASDQLAKAEREYRDVLRLDSADPTAVRELALIYQGQGQILQGYPLLKRATELRPEDWEVQLKLGQLLLALREFAQARDVALQILEKQPADQGALLLLADTAATPDEIDEVRKQIESFREKDQDRPGYHIAFGALAARQKDETRAENEFKAALTLDPK